MPVVYIDILFLLNLLMDTITLYLSSLLTKRSISLLRLFTSSTLLSVYSCMIFFPQLDIFYTIIGKLAVLTLASVTAFPSRNFWQISKNTLLIFVVSAVLGGIVLAMIFLTDFGTALGAAVSNGEVYLDISASTLLLSALLSYFGIYVVSFANRRERDLSSLILNAEITLFDKSIKIPIFADTGCLIRDPIKNRPAIILSKTSAQKLIPKEVLNALENPQGIKDLGDYKQRYSVLLFSALDKKGGILHGFVPDKVAIAQTVLPPCVIAISKRDLARDSRFEGIFNPTLFDFKVPITTYNT